jgi:CBS domain-containing protein
MLEYNDSLIIGDIIRIIATEHERTCILKNSDGRLYGVLSQGDLIKAIWNGAELITPISNIINPNPLTISTESKDPKKEALKLFIQSLPQGAVACSATVHTFQLSVQQNGS